MKINECAVEWESDIDLCDVKRYSREIIVPNYGIKSHKIVSNTKVLVVGLGGLGSPVLLYLASSGIKEIGIVDYDDVELHNLQRQIIHTEEQIGRSKVESAYNTISNLNSSIKIIKHTEMLNSKNVGEIISKYDLILDCCDSAITRYIISDTCSLLAKDLICGSVLSWSGQIFILPRNGPCYRCLFPEPKHDYSTCNSNGVIGPMCGVIGSLQATEAIKFIISEPTTKIILYNGYTNTYQNINKSGHENRCIVCRSKQADIYKNYGKGDKELDLLIDWEHVLNNIDNYLLVDIRSHEHFRMLRIPGSINCDAIDTLIEKYSEKGKKIVVFCYSGNNSYKFVNKLKNKGIKAYSCKGGLEKLKEMSNFYSLIN